MVVEFDKEIRTSHMWQTKPFGESLTDKVYHAFQILFGSCLILMGPKFPDISDPGGPKCPIDTLESNFWVQSVLGPKFPDIIAAGYWLVCYFRDLWCVL